MKRQGPEGPACTWCSGSYPCFLASFVRNSAVSTQVGLAVLCCAVLCCAVLCCAVLCCAVTMWLACWIAAEHLLQHLQGLDKPLLASIVTPLPMHFASKEATLLLLHQLHVLVHASDASTVLEVLGVHAHSDAGAAPLPMQSPCRHSKVSASCHDNVSGNLPSRYALLWQVLKG